jgi:uroporphyrin-3 C-methyltransferase
MAIAVAGMLWWQYRQFYVSLDETDASTAVALERIRAEQRSLQDGLRDVRDSLEAMRQRNVAFGERVDALPGRLAELERRLDAVQGGSFNARSNLLRSEAEYYLTVANTQLTLAADWDNAIKALELADGLLVELAQPSLAPVREAIADELLSLRSVRLPDIEGVVFSLGRLAGRVDGLPLRADLPERFADRPEAESGAEPGLARLWLAIKRTLLGIVHIERRDEPVPQALSAMERSLARRQLVVELDFARLAALRAQTQAFRSSLDRAIAILQQDFAVNSAEIDGALTLLRELRGFELEPPRPNIGDSLSLLRRLGDEAR